MINKLRFNNAIDKFHQLRILCIGDVMLDQFYYGDVNRISPEAPVPVMTIREDHNMLGGSGNVVRNILSMEGKCTFFSVIGDDAVGRIITQLVNKEIKKVWLEGEEQSNLISYMHTTNTRLSTSKVRYIAGSQHLLRADLEDTYPLPEYQEQRIIDMMLEEIPLHDAVIISDYQKGYVTPVMAKAIIHKARESNTRVIVDTKAKEISHFAGADIITPNIHEFCDIIGYKVETKNEIETEARALLNDLDIGALLVTRGKEGMSLFIGSEIHHLPATAKQVFDVSGAGDTVVATLALAMCSGLNVLEAAFLANLSASVSVSHSGTYAVTEQDLRLAIIAEDRIGGIEKIMELSDLKEYVFSWQEQECKIGFANGCFDLLHAGHVSMLQTAKSQCDKLIVAINSDDSVRTLKGEGRPINDQYQRALVLAAMTFVDAVIIFNSDTPLATISALKPDILFKGSDYAGKEIIGSDVVEKLGGRVVLIPHSGHSTTKIIERAKGIESIVKN